MAPRPSARAPSGAVRHVHASIVGCPVAFRTDWLPILPVLAYVARFLDDRFYGVAFSPPFTCDNEGALFALWRFGIQKPCNMLDFWQIPTSDCMKHEGTRRRAPQRARSHDRSPDRIGRRHANHHRGRVRRLVPFAGAPPARLPVRLHAFVLPASQNHPPTGASRCTLVCIQDSQPYEDVSHVKHRRPQHRERPAQHSVIPPNAYPE